MFNLIIVQPIFNLLVFIYALLPGHNFGLALVIFTIVIRLLLWPLVKKQLHQTKKMRSIQPELRRIAKEAAGDRVKQQQMQMELYKERGINPFGTIGIAIIQLPILIGLYSGLRRVINDPHQMVDFAYPFLQHLPWMQHLSTNIHLFDASLFGVVDLGRSALGPQGLYIPALIIVLASAVTQYFQARQLMPDTKDARGMRQILKEAGQGKQADSQEMNAAMSRVTRYILPIMIFVFTVNLASALALYWFVGGLVAFIQQSIVLHEDEEEMEDLGESNKNRKNIGKIPEAEIVQNPTDSKVAASEAKGAPELKKPPQKPTPKPITGGSTVTSITRSKRGKK